MTEPGIFAASADAEGNEWPDDSLDEWVFDIGLTLTDIATQYARRLRNRERTP